MLTVVIQGVYKYPICLEKYDKVCHFLSLNS